MPLPNRQPIARLIGRLAALLVPIALLGEAGHQLFERLHRQAAHHAFHLIFAAGAVIVFGLYLVREIRRNGWPSFSWRLRPEPEAKPRKDLGKDRAAA